MADGPMGSVGYREVLAQGVAAWMVQLWNGRLVCESTFLGGGGGGGGGVCVCVCVCVWGWGS